MHTTHKQQPAHATPPALHTLATQGYCVLPGMVSPQRVAELREQVASLSPAAARNGLDLPWCQALAADLLAHPDMAMLCGPGALAVQCTVFDKSPSRNWLVAWHQDLCLPVAERVDTPGWQAWSTKHQVCFAQPPAHVLARMLALRLHLDDCGEHDGGLRVMPGTHLAGVGNPAHPPAQAAQALCLVPEGGALLMRPLLWHASSKSTSGRPRRVLHFVLAPRDLLGHAPSNSQAASPHLRWRWHIAAGA